MNWKVRQAKDPWVKAAREGGWRSRAVFKLREIDSKYKLFKRGMCVVDLGAAPGAWSQYAASRVGKHGSVVAIDLLEISPLRGVEVLRGNVCTQEGADLLRDSLGERRADLVISDMAPNMTGMASVDIPSSLVLAQAASDTSDTVLVNGGGLVIKAFQGAGFDEYVAGLKRRYSRVVTVKPEASRSASREVYILARS